MEKILFPVKIMGISQGMNSNYSHKGTHAIDLCWYNEENKKVYAPFTGKIVKIYNDNNTVWLQSCDKVLFADGAVDYATIRLIHANDISNLKVGQIISQGEYFYKMGKKGKATGTHLHLEISKGHVTGWKPKNKYGNYEMPNTINVYDGFMIDDTITVKNGYGYNWKHSKDVNYEEPTVEETLKFSIGNKVIINGNLYENANIESASGSVKNKITTITRAIAKTKHPYNTTGDLGWMNEEDIKLYEETPKEQDTTYIVKKGDNLTRIAKKYNTSISKLIELNKLKYPKIETSNGNFIDIGWKLIIK